MLSQIRRPSPALVVAIIALIAASGGWALAAIPAGNGTITACYAKANGNVRIVDASKKCKRRVEKRITWNQKGKDGAAGLPGQNGANGAAGTHGTNGTNGTNGASALTATAEVNLTVTSAAPATAFAAALGTSGATSSESDVQLTWPRTVVASDFSVMLKYGAPNPGANRFSFTLRVDGADTPVTCEITGTARGCTSGAATVTIPAGGRVALGNQQLGTSDGAARPYFVRWAERAP